MNNSPAPSSEPIALTNDRPPVIVLMFDWLSFPTVELSDVSHFITSSSTSPPQAAMAGQGASDLTTASCDVDSALTTSVWDQLDLESAFFEQHYSQRPVSALTGSDHLQQEHKSPDWRYVSCSSGSLRQRLNQLSEEGNQPDGLPSERRSLTAGVGCLWIAIHPNTPQPCQDADVAAVLDWLDQAQSGHQCTLIVTARQSQGLALADNSNPSAEHCAAVDSQPTAAPVTDDDEVELSHCHVPLWIRLPDRRMRRIQSLSGSFDLVPTICEILDRSPKDLAQHDLHNSPGHTRHTPPAQSAAAQQAAASATDAAHDLTELPEPQPTSSSLGVLARNASSELVSHDSQASNQPDRPRSLISLCFHPGQLCVRVLKIQTQTCELLRNDGFLAVRNLEQTGNDGLKASTGFNETRLYVKPEDVWQVNNQARVYESVLEEFDKLW